MNFPKVPNFPHNAGMSTQIVKTDSGKTKTGYLWVYLDFGRCVFFEWHASRDGVQPAALGATPVLGGA